MTRTWQRWLPALVVPTLIGAGALVNASQAGATVDLPDRTAAQVLAMIGESSVDALSGTLEQTSDLGLPELPTEATGAGGGTGTGGAALELLTGSHTARVYLDGPSRLRVQVLDTLAERDAIRNEREIWLYSSADNAATHIVAPADQAPADESADRTTDEQTMPGHVGTPAEVAEELLAAIDPSTRVTVGTDTVVAGRSAYELVLTPRTTQTLVGSVSIAVDSETGLPLSVAVTARGQDEPAFRIAFTQIDLSTPPAARFEFTPPPGATVTELVPDLPSAIPESGIPGSTTLLGIGRPTVSGSGWDAVVEMPLGLAATVLTDSPLLEQLTHATAGGRVLESALITVLVTDDGRILVGPVPPERLLAAAGTR
ncbi:LolA family protein [Pengzhenrongella frigida]|uniref:DUF2092 domain-containing protein n=1 Tax=Pengzhenrongella frigida TaxID=1259133 RepID=A0A4Q5N0S2_9MICO|nr:DUF2092 domain-containing protein [Cellulomonas sp. HLT2-17]RYV50097.1 DUF2092 domain-containing protein [Cellulomonas sp. HLT2-17]